MCLAVSPPDAGRGKGHWLRARPGRLLTFGALLQAALAAAALAAPAAPSGVAPALAGAICAVLPGLLFGRLLERLPGRLPVGEPDYLRYGSVFLLLLWGWGLVAAGYWFATWLAVAGLLLMLAGWAVALATLGEWVRWAPEGERRFLGWLMKGLKLSALSLLLLPLAAAGRLPWGVALGLFAAGLLPALVEAAGARGRTPAVACQRS